MKILYLMLCILSLKAFAQEICNSNLIIADEKIETLSKIAFKATQESYKKLVNISVKHAGNGDLSILVNESNEIVAVRFNYRDGDDVKILNVTAEELNSGKSLEYPGQDGAVSPLRLSVARPPGLIPGSGATFNLDIATDLDPLKLQNYQLKLTKSGNSWSVAHGNKAQVNDVVIHPGISWASWNGTFKKIEFK
jgi:hypothetical protein